MGLKPGHARVVFDEIAFAEDVMHSGRTGACVLRETRRYERYLPEPNGKFGMVLALSGDENGLALRYLAFGMRHHPKGSRAKTVYQVAHRRLRG